MTQEWYVDLFLGNLSTNIAAIIRSGLTLNARDIGLQRNLSPWGNLRDTEELEPMKIPQEFMITVKSMFDTSFFMAEKLKMTKAEWINSAYFEHLLMSFIADLGGEEAAQENSLATIESIRQLISREAALTGDDGNNYGVVWMMAPVLYDRGSTSPE